MLSILMQKLFFKNMRGLPNPAWVRRAKSLGQFKTFEVFRAGKVLALYIIQPQVARSVEPSPVVIFSHPITRKGKYFYTESGRAQRYLQQGYAVVAFDYNGFGESESHDLYYWQDVVAIINKVESIFPGSPVVLHGASFGAFHIIKALDYLPANTRVVLENVNRSLYSYWQRWFLLAMLVRLLQVCQIKAVKDMDVANCARSFSRSDIFLQFIACELDQFTTVDEMRLLYKLFVTENKTFTVFSGAGHLAAPKHNSDLYQSTLFGLDGVQC